MVSFLLLFVLSTVALAQYGGYGQSGSNGYSPSYSSPTYLYPYYNDYHDDSSSSSSSSSEEKCSERKVEKAKCPKKLRSDGTHCKTPNTKRVEMNDKDYLKVTCNGKSNEWTALVTGNGKVITVTSGKLEHVLACSDRKDKWRTRTFKGEKIYLNHVFCVTGELVDKFLEKKGAPSGPPSTPNPGTPRLVFVFPQFAVSQPDSNCLSCQTMKDSATGVLQGLAESGGDVPPVTLFVYGLNQTVSAIGQELLGAGAWLAGFPCDGPKNTQVDEEFGLKQLKRQTQIQSSDSLIYFAPCEKIKIPSDKNDVSKKFASVEASVKIVIQAKDTHSSLYNTDNTQFVNGDDAATIAPEILKDLQK
ncbi:unnamed protein product, partial [Mesorhabditis belari]|uniref:Uncharacterized protein n=1 Tax=Mesorhabditis belari TaxID=2138241 RepID=A0AAF3EJL8_9BILA